MSMSLARYVKGIGDARRRGFRGVLIGVLGRSSAQGLLESVAASQAAILSEVQGVVTNERAAPFPLNGKYLGILFGMEVFENLDDEGDTYQVFCSPSGFATDDWRILGVGQPTDAEIGVWVPK